MKSWRKGNGNYYTYVKLSLKMLRKKRTSLLQCCSENMPLPRAKRQCHHQKGSKLPYFDLLDSHDITDRGI